MEIGISHPAGSNPVALLVILVILQGSAGIGGVDSAQDYIPDHLVSCSNHIGIIIIIIIVSSSSSSSIDIKINKRNKSD